MQLIDVIKQRKTIKLFDKNVKISRDELSEILTLAQLSPSKANVQPWRFVVIDDEEKKQTLLGDVAFNIQPCESASALILVLADLRYDKLLGSILDQSIAQGCLASQFRDKQHEFLLNFYNGLSQSQLRDQVLIDTSLSAMQLMLVAKEKGYDTHAIGIFDREEVLEKLAVDSERYVPVMLIAIGKAATSFIPSVRLPLEYTVSWNSGPNK
ncbi:nitroreductase [Vespertiliibacter pulmonis]|uniref:Nitroreductase domain-containing protein n=1 Tax=Vespertiliibacter pulmonis TaxID=1443036 RepID=A0A3N4VQR9_9PAST|nr:nitroreductase family protein [Vespertiliibacter pulmonis]QLB21213.1 nitroreductase [Vespertiliibacter pulmonis]RPE83675.1 hypothetical protein EDC46_0876 [Vespertiliibacter pulmonis]